MATELLFEAYTKYIEPLLDFGWIRLNEQGFLVEREYGHILHYTNDHFSGKPGEVPNMYPVLPLSDEHYIQIKENPEWELFNPFSSIKHMTLVTLEFKRGLINYHLSEAASQLPLEQQEDLIQFYYNKYGEKYIVGFCNVEDESNPKELYNYTADDFVSAMWGLCVTAFNDIDRKHEEYFYAIEKTWRKALRLISKWDEARIKIIRQNKVDQKIDYGFQDMDLSDTASAKISDYPRDYFISAEDQDDYLLSLFGPHELLPAVGPCDPILKKEKHWQLPDFASDETIFKHAKRLAKQEVTLTPPKVEDNKEEIEAVVEPEVKSSRPILPHPAMPSLPYPQFPPALYPSPPPQPQPFYGPGFGPYSQYMYPPAPIMPMMPQQMPMPQNIPTDINQIDFESAERPDPFAPYKKYE
jgi:hypothetical protein